VLLCLNYHVANLSASLEISLPYQAVYYYLLNNLVSGPSFVPTVIAALHPSNISPFVVKQRIGPIAYHLKLPYQMKQLHLVFNVVKLTLAPDDPIIG